MEQTFNHLSATRLLIISAKSISNGEYLDAIMGQRRSHE